MSFGLRIGFYRLADAIDLIGIQFLTHCFQHLPELGILIVLGDESSHAQLQRLLPVVGIAGHRVHDDGDVPVAFLRLDLDQKFKAVHDGHVQIQKNNVGQMIILRFDPVNGRFSV